jgi:HAMP domain-containing protein
VGKLFDRDIALLDRDGKILEAADAKLVGTVYHHPEVVATLQDGRVRTFEAPDLSGPGTAQFVVAPLTALQPADVHAPRRGAVIFEYTAVFDGAMEQAKQAAMATAVGAFVMILIGGLLAVQAAKHVVRPLQELTLATTNLATSAYQTRMPFEGTD